MTFALRLVIIAKATQTRPISGSYWGSLVTWVKIEEVPENQWGIGGQPLNAAMIQAMKHKSAA